jgi:hypothetical protein
MKSDAKLPIAIFAAIVVVIATPFILDLLRQARRPLLLEARIVTATASDPVFREGQRQIPAGEEIETALALRIGRRGSQGEWFAPVSRLVIDGRDPGHVQTATWPEAGRVLRVFWFSVESTNLGGRLSPENAAERLQYRTFLAPEMGQALRADRLPDTHNDDHIGQQSTTTPSEAGTVRLYARVEVVETLSDLRPLQSMTTRSVDAVFEADFPAISRSADFGDAVHNVVGELFGLPGFEPIGHQGGWNEVTVAAFGRPFTQLVSDRLVVSSRTLAAVAVAGTPDIDPARFARLGRIEISPDRLSRRGRELRWKVDVIAGDLLVEGDHWWVLLGDDGNGVLDSADSVLHCWGRPPERTTMWASFESEEMTVDHLRYGD